MEENKVMDEGALAIVETEDDGNSTGIKSQPIQNISQTSLSNVAHPPLKLPVLSQSQSTTLPDSVPNVITSSTTSRITQLLSNKIYMLSHPPKQSISNIPTTLPLSIQTPATNPLHVKTEMPDDHNKTTPSPRSILTQPVQSLTHNGSYQISPGTNVTLANLPVITQEDRSKFSMTEQLASILSKYQTSNPSTGSPSITSTITQKVQDYIQSKKSESINISPRNIMPTASPNNLHIPSPGSNQQLSNSLPGLHYTGNSLPDIPTHQQYLSNTSPIRNSYISPRNFPMEIPRPFKCSFCGKGFTRKYHATRHEREVHERKQRPFLENGYIPSYDYRSGENSNHTIDSNAYRAVDNAAYQIKMHSPNGQISPRQTFPLPNLGLFEQWQAKQQYYIQKTQESPGNVPSFLQQLQEKTKELLGEDSELGQKVEVGSKTPVDLPGLSPLSKVTHNSGDTSSTGVDDGIDTVLEKNTEMICDSTIGPAQGIAESIAKLLSASVENLNPQPKIFADQLRKATNYPPIIPHHFPQRRDLNSEEKTILKMLDPEQQYNGGIPNPDYLKKERSYLCPFCERPFGRRYHLTRHLRTVHKEHPLIEQIIPTIPTKRSISKINGFSPTSHPHAQDYETDPSEETLNQAISAFSTQHNRQQKIEIILPLIHKLQGAHLDELFACIMHALLPHNYVGQNVPVHATYFNPTHQKAAKVYHDQNKFTNTLTIDLQDQDKHKVCIPSSVREEPFMQRGGQIVDDEQMSVPRKHDPDIALPTLPDSSSISLLIQNIQNGHTEPETKRLRAKSGSGTSSGIGREDSDDGPDTPGNASSPGEGDTDILKLLSAFQQEENEARESLPESIKSQSIAVQRDHVCPYEECDAKFTRKSTLVRHIRERHANTRRYQCNECGKSFFRNYHLTRHQTQHIHDTCFPTAGSDPAIDNNKNEDKKMEMESEVKTELPVNSMLQQLYKHLESCKKVVDREKSTEETQATTTLFNNFMIDREALQQAFSSSII